MRIEERERCIEAVATLARIDPDNLANDPQSTFLPLDSTRRALVPDVFIVLGSRGTGKTALFRLVTAPAARRVIGEAFDLSLDRTQWIRCFSARGTDEPDVAVLEDLSEFSDIDLRALWACLLVRSIVRRGERAFEIPASLSWILKVDLNRIRDWIPVARATLGEIISTLDALDHVLKEEDRTIFCCYDALDRISPFSRDMRRRHLRVLLALWSSLSSRYRAIRAKIFLREDLADPTDLEFPDASKMLTRSASLAWSHEDLSRLVVRYLATHSDEMRNWLCKVKGLVLRDDPHLGRLPGPMPSAVRKAFTTRLTGLAIGTGIFRVETGRWITGRLEDANRTITPRTVLRFFGRAGEESLRRAHDEPRRSQQLLDQKDLSAALRYTSHLRVAELRDDYPVVNRIRNLAGLRTPISTLDAVRHLAQPSPGERLPHVGEDGAAILEEIKRLGVVSVHRDLGSGEVVDVPDIYRFGFGIEADYAAAISSFLTHGASALRWVQRGELPELDAVLASQLNEDVPMDMIEKARDLYRSEDVVGSISLLENILSFAEYKNETELQLLAMSQMVEVVSSFDPMLSIDVAENGLRVLEHHPYLPLASAWKRLFSFQECIAWLWVGDVGRAREVYRSLDGIDVGDPLFGDGLWIKAQLALRDRDLQAAVRIAVDLVQSGHDKKSTLHEWRGYLVAAAAVLLAGARSSPTVAPKGLMPWVIHLDGIDEPRIRIAILLSLAPLGESEPSSLERLAGEQFAAQLISSLGRDISISEMGREAAARRPTLLDEATALVSC